MVDLARDVRLPDVQLRPEYEGLARYLRSLKTLEDFRVALARAVERDRYILAVLLGYDDEDHRWDLFHLWAIRRRIPELRAIPGCQSFWFCPRGTYKTALEEVDLTWSCLFEWRKTFGVASWKLDVAGRIVRSVKKNLQHPVLYWLFPERLWENPRRADEKWSDTELTVKRPGVAAKDATLTAFALEAPATSLHFDRLYLDDVVEKRNSSTEFQIEKVKDTLRDIRSLRVNRNSQIEGRGTVWDPDDWHCTSVLKGTSWVVERHPAIVERPEEYPDAAPAPVPVGDDRCLFPYTKPLDVLVEDEAQMGPWHYRCQMLLRVEAVGDAAWTRDQVEHFYDPNDLPKAWRPYLFLDLATEDPESDDPDDTALLLVVAGPPGPHYKLWLVDGRAKQRWAWSDVAKTIFDWSEAWGASLYYEAVSAFQSFNHALHAEAQKRGRTVPALVMKREPGSGGAVKERIKVLDAWLPQGRIVTRDPQTVEDADSRHFFEVYLRQATRWPRTAHDDVLEMVSDAARLALPPNLAMVPEQPRRRIGRVR